MDLIIFTFNMISGLIVLIKFIEVTSSLIIIKSTISIDDKNSALIFSEKYGLDGFSNVPV